MSGLMMWKIDAEHDCDETYNEAKVKIFVKYSENMRFLPYNILSWRGRWNSSSHFIFCVCCRPHLIHYYLLNKFVIRIPFVIIFNSCLSRWPTTFPFLLFSFLILLPILLHILGYHIFVNKNKFSMKAYHFKTAALLFG